jgi:hypothetical protein
MLSISCIGFKRIFTLLEHLDKFEVAFYSMEINFKLIESQTPG